MSSDMFYLVLQSLNHTPMSRQLILDNLQPLILRIPRPSILGESHLRDALSKAHDILSEVLDRINLVVRQNDGARTAGELDLKRLFGVLETVSCPLDVILEETTLTLFMAFVTSSLKFCSSEILTMGIAGPDIAGEGVKSSRPSHMATTKTAKPNKFADMLDSIILLLFN